MHPRIEVRQAHDAESGDKCERGAGKQQECDGKRYRIVHHALPFLPFARLRLAATWGFFGARAVFSLCRSATVPRDITKRAKATVARKPTRPSEMAMSM